MKISTALTWILLILLLGLIPLVGCSIPEIPRGSPDRGTPFITDGTAARDFIFEFLSRKYGFGLSAADLNWEQVDLFPDAHGDASAIQYTAGSFWMVVAYPLVAPEKITFSIQAKSDAQDFSWNGLLDPYGHILEIEVSEKDPSPTVTQTPPLITTALATNPPSQPSTPSPRPTDLPGPSSTPTISGLCNRAGFIGDITIPDGSNFAPGTSIIKTWRLQNTGSCTWTKDYDLVYIRGPQMDGSDAIPLPHDVRPGENIDISVDLITPADPGGYKGFWMLRSQEGENFGLGFTGNDTFSVILNVLEKNPELRYDFAFNFCSAIWRSETGRLSCSNTTTEKYGSVRLLKNPTLETRDENQLGLQMHPKEEVHGWIDGTYPYSTIQEKDHFRAAVGCLKGYVHCNVSFYLDYESADGTINHLGRWEEVYDGAITLVDIDLSALKGQNVRFILGMEANTKDVEDAQGIWLAPRIEEKSGSGNTGNPN
jgi:hypothetical protein